MAGLCRYQSIVRRHCMEGQDLLPVRFKDVTDGK